MSENALLRYGRAAAYMASPQAGYTRNPASPKVAGSGGSARTVTAILVASETGVHAPRIASG